MISRLNDVTILKKMLVHCELYLCNINRLDIRKEVNLIWISQSTEYSNYMSVCQDRNTQRSANESKHLPLSYLD